MSGKQEQNALHGKSKLLGGAPTPIPVSDRTMDDGTLDQLSALLRFGCSVKLACKEVGVARTTFYRWLERIRSMQLDSRWASASESCRIFAEIMNSCHRAKEALNNSVNDTVELNSPGDGASLSSPNLDHHLELKPDVTLLPEVNPENFVNIPDRLRRHFLNIMHYAIKKKFWRDKSWPNMTTAEKAALQQLSEEITMRPTNISDPLVFDWGGTRVTKRFTTYEFMRPCSLLLTIRYLRDRSYRAGKRGLETNASCDSQSVPLLEYDSQDLKAADEKDSFKDDSFVRSFEHQRHRSDLDEAYSYIDELSSKLESQCQCDQMIAAANAIPILEWLQELSPQITGNVMVVHHGRGNSVRWLLSNTKASSICALDWCPIVNAAASALHMAHSLVSSSAVSITAPGHVLLLGEHFDSPAFDFIIDTNVAVFNLDYPPLFPEKLRELPQVKQHLRCICKLLRRGGVATLLCRNAEILDVVMCDLQSTSLEVVHSIRCLGSKQESTMTLKDQEVWVVARKKY